MSPSLAFRIIASIATLFMASSAGAQEAAQEAAQAPPPAPATVTVPQAAGEQPSLEELQAESARLRDELERLRRDLEAGEADSSSEVPEGVADMPASPGDELTPLPQAKPPGVGAPVERPRPAATRPTQRQRSAPAAPTLRSVSLPPPFFAMMFEPGSVKLSDRALEELARAVDGFDLFSASELLVIGFSDGVGDPRFNARLAAGRASTVQAVLLAFGVPAERIIALGHHELGIAPPRAAARGRAEPWNRVAYLYVGDAARKLLADLGRRGRPAVTAER